jgi:hypothetical protein
MQVDSDWKADPVLEEACEEVVTSSCDPKVTATPLPPFLAVSRSSSVQSLNIKCVSTFIGCGCDIFIY